MTEIRIATKCTTEASVDGEVWEVVAIDAPVDGPLTLDDARTAAMEAGTRPGILVRLTLRDSEDRILAESPTFEATEESSAYLNPPSATYATAIEIVRDAYVSSDVDGLTHRVDGDQVTAILEVGSEFFAMSEEYTDGEVDGYSWAWGERTTDDVTGEVFTDYFGEDGGTTEAEARQAIAEWLARFPR